MYDLTVMMAAPELSARSHPHTLILTPRSPKLALPQSCELVKDGTDTVLLYRDLMQESKVKALSHLESVEAMRCQVS